METLIGKPINLSDTIALSKSELEASCKKLSAEIGTTFEVNMDEGREPCPFFCSSIDKPFDFVFVGLNPGKPLKALEGLFSWQHTTWQELVDFCVPTDIRGEKNGYQFLKANNVESDYYQFFLRLHVALTTGEIFNTWDDLKKRHADVEKFFIEHIATHSILNADLVPYKSDKTPKFNATGLLDDTSYVNYFRQLIQFIETESTPDAWIVFYGGREEIKNLLNSFAPSWQVPTKTLRLRADETKNYSYFYLFAEGKRKILLLPFLLTPYSTSSIYNNISILIDQLKFFEKIVAVAKN